jgi:hypothetical protein
MNTKNSRKFTMRATLYDVRTFLETRDEDFKWIMENIKMILDRNEKPPSN